MNERIVFITGLGGVGKSTLAKYFQKHPIRGWQIFDFDEGKFSIPKDDKEIKQWRARQHDWFLQESTRIIKEEESVCIIGVCEFPWQTDPLPSMNLISKDNIRYAFLHLDPNVRHERLFNRGDEHLWQDDQAKFEAIGYKLEKFGAHRFDITGQTVEQTAKMVRDWLISM